MTYKQDALLKAYDKIWTVLDYLEDKICPDRQDITFISQLFVDIFAYTTNQLYKVDVKGYDLKGVIDYINGGN